jgi:hypothetical protein
LTKNDARPAKKPRTDVELVDDQQDLQVSLAWFEKVTPERATFIQAVADRIKNHGAGFKNVLMEREVDNPQFSFLFNEEVRYKHLHSRADMTSSQTSMCFNTASMTRISSPSCPNRTLKTT